MPKPFFDQFRMTNPDTAYYSGLIASNLAYIEKRCYKAFGLYD